MFPNLPNIDELFKMKWKTRLSQCSKLVLNALIKEYGHRLDNLDGEVKTLTTQGSKWQDHPLFKVKDTNLRIHFEAFNKNIIKNKDIKFEEDKLAFQEVRVYRWPSVSQSDLFKPNNLASTNANLNRLEVGD